MKYKLIKLLPFENSPRIGYTSEPHLSQKDEDHYWNGNWFNPKNYPEFWKLVVEKDYKILSLARFCSIKPRITDVSNYGDEYIEALLKCDKARVHSVKRLSDGEIFTIGDKLNDKSFTINARHSLIANPTDLYDNKITKIAIVKDYHSEVAGYSSKDNLTGTLMFSASNKWNNLNVSLKDAIKAKQPLFTTEDGVDIYEGDTYWWVNTNFWEARKEKITNIREHNAQETGYNVGGNFSTKEKAEEYILMNKPCLSYNEVLNATKIRNKNTFETLKELVKSKIKQSV